MQLIMVVMIKMMIVMLVKNDDEVMIKITIQ